MREGRFNSRIGRLTKAGLVGVLVTAAAAFGASPAASEDGAPQGAGGCHMIINVSVTGGYHMMSGSANGEGAANMLEMLGRFAPC